MPSMGRRRGRCERLELLLAGPRILQQVAQPRTRARLDRELSCRAVEVQNRPCVELDPDRGAVLALPAHFCAVQAGAAVGITVGYLTWIALMGVDVVRNGIDKAHQFPEVADELAKLAKEVIDQPREVIERMKKLLGE